MWLKYIKQVEKSYAEPFVPFLITNNSEVSQTLYVPLIMNHNVTSTWFVSRLHREGAFVGKIRDFPYLTKTVSDHVRMGIHLLLKLQRAGSSTH